DPATAMINAATATYHGVRFFRSAPAHCILAVMRFFRCGGGSNSRGRSSIIIASDEASQLRVRARQITLRRSFFDAEHRRDLRVRVLVDVVEDDDLAIAQRQPRDPSLEVDPLVVR